jgi:FkbM family methyltransferase
MSSLARQFFRSMPKGIQARLLNWTPPFASAQIALPDGADLSLDQLDQSQMLKGLYWSGIRYFEFNTVMLFWALARRSRVILDIGSYFGYYAMLAARANAAASILSFEPVPENQALQRHFLKRNRCANVALHGVAVGQSVGEAKFFLPSWSHSKLPNIGSLNNRFQHGEMFADRAAREIRVPVQTLDSIVMAENLAALDLIKIDVEDMEWQVIAGGREALTHWSPDVIAEVNPNSQASEKLVAAMQGHGYTLYQISNQLRRLASLSDLHDLRSLRGGGFGEVLFSRRDADTLESISAECQALLTQV